MPKDKIYDNAELFDIEVGWSREGESVQLGLATHDGRSLAEWLAGQDENRERTVGEQLAAPAGFASLWATLDRAQINRLIKSLRKARDDAYGRDE